MLGNVLHTSSSSENIRKWVEDKTKQYCPHEHCEGREKEVVCIHNYEKLDKLEKRKDFLLIHKQATGHQVHRL
jgi:hypothetical protein